MVWLILALSGPILWGASNVLDSALRRHYVKNDWALAWLMAAGRLPFALIFLFLGGWNFPDWISILWMLIGGALWALPFLFYFKALKTEDTSRVSIFLQMVPAFTLINAFFILNEKLTVSQGISFGLLLLAGLLASLKTFRGRCHPGIAFAWLTLSCLLWSLSDILFKKFEPAFSNFNSAFAILLLGTFLVAAALAIHPAKRQESISHLNRLPVRAWILICADVIVGVLGTILFNYALTLGKVSLTSAMMGIQPLAAFLIGIGLAPFMKEISREDVQRKTLALKLAAFVLAMIGLATLGM
jgi:drug/metabolite transporter (DMT)-like permease